jgi:hypothetical protein
MERTSREIRAFALPTAPCLFVALLPALQYIEGENGETFANAGLERENGGSVFRSVSLFLSNSPAAGAFGFLIGCTVTAFSFRSNLSQFVIQKMTLIALFFSLFLLVCTPVLVFPTLHKITTSLVMISSSFFLVVTTILFHKNWKVWALSFLAVAVLLATLVLRINASGRNLGYSYYFAELVWLVLILGLTAVTVNDTPTSVSFR